VGEAERPVAGYYRVSVAREDMRAPELYEDEISRYCRYKRVELAEVFSDIDFSGYRGAKPRPALERLIEQRSEYAAVIVPKLSRFGRSMKDLVELFDIFDRDGIALVFLDMNLDTSTSQGRLLRHIMAAFAEYESDVKSDYMHATHRMMAREGRPHGPLAPYGYRVVGRKSERTYVIDKEAAAVIKGLFHGYLAGGSLNTMARELNDKGIRMARGGKWSRQRIKLFLDNPAYAGFRIYKGEEFKTKWPPIVSRQVYDEVKARRHAIRSTYVDGPGVPSYLLSTLIVCELCGKNLHRGRAKDRGDIYRCRTGDGEPPGCLGGQIKAERAEQIVIDAANQILGLARDRDMVTRAGEWRSKWVKASLAGRRELLGELMNKVVLVAKPPGNRNGRGLPIGRPLKIHWASVWSVSAFGYPGATSLLEPGDLNVHSAKGKSWGEWRRLRLLPR
jgi:DNA invertase Pin-like site-specific DNA recombinase